jgi:hypothetical protein
MQHACINQVHCPLLGHHIVIVLSVWKNTKSMYKLWIWLSIENNVVPGHGTVVLPRMCAFQMYQSKLIKIGLWAHLILNTWAEKYFYHPKYMWHFYNYNQSLHGMWQTEICFSMNWHMLGESGGADPSKSLRDLQNIPPSPYVLHNLDCFVIEHVY